MPKMLQERLATKYKLSPQVSKMLALLVLNPTVTATTFANHFGRIDARNLVRRLRRQMKEPDDAVVVQTMFGFGNYCLDKETRARLAADTDPIHISQPPTGIAP